MNIDLTVDRTGVKPRSGPVACCAPLAGAPMSAVDAEGTARLFKALGDPARVRIVNLLATSEAQVCVCDITPVLGLAQATVSHHLKKLVDAGLLHREQRGTWAFYSVDAGALAQIGAIVSIEGGTT